MKKLYPLLVTGIIFTVSSCNKNRVSCEPEKGERTTDIRSVEEFKGVQLTSGVDVFISELNKFEVRIESDEVSTAIVDTYVKDEILYIDIKNNSSLKGQSSVKVFVSAPEYEYLGISGSGDITTETDLNCENLKIKVTGSGDINISNLDATSSELYLTGSGDINLYGGNADYYTVKLSGSGDLNSFGFLCDAADVKVTGSGNANVYIFSSLNATLTGSGDVVYKGIPDVITTSTGTGSIYPY